MDPQIDEQVAKVLGGLKKVNAPKNFEGRVLARLSSPPEEENRFGFLKLALPTAALAGLALFLFLSVYLGADVPTVDVATTPQATETTVQQQPEPQRAVAAENNVQSPTEFRGPEPAEARPPAAVTASRSKKRSDGNVSNNLPLNGNGSYDIGSGTDTRILPKGFDTNSRSDPAMERQMRRPSVMVSEVLRYTGAVGEFRENGWFVASIVPNSVAARIGLRPGDVIVSLNDIKVGKAASFPSGVDIKMVRVSRDGRIVELKF